MYFKQYLSENMILNYLGDVEIRMSENKGRGLFASKLIEQGQLILVEKSLISASNKIELIQKCKKLYDLKGQDALRISSMYFGQNYRILKTPD